MSYYWKQLEEFSKKHKEVFEVLTQLLSILGGMSIVLLLVYPPKKKPVNFFNEIEHLDRMLAAITKKADLELIKHIYSNPKIIKKENPSAVFTSPGYVSIDEQKSFHQTMMSLKEKIILDSTLNVDFMLKKVDELITGYKATNPFDVLPENQRYFFKNLKSKSDSIYPVIENDISKIVSEMDYQNGLIKTYLNKAENSYRNSMIAMSIASLSLFLGLFFNLRNSFRRFNSSTESVTKRQLPVIKNE